MHTHKDSFSLTFCFWMTSCSDVIPEVVTGFLRLSGYKPEDEVKYSNTVKMVKRKSGL